MKRHFSIIFHASWASSNLLIFSKVVQHSTLYINRENFFVRNISTNFHESCTPSSMAHHIKLLKYLTKLPINHYNVVMISLMLRSLRRVCNAIFCYYYRQFHSEGDKKLILILLFSDGHQLEIKYCNNRILQYKSGAKISTLRISLRRYNYKFGLVLNFSAACSM